MSALFPLVLSGATTSRRGRRLIGPIDLTLDGAGTTILLGPNGAGKTTLLRLMHGLARLSGGSLRWNAPTDEAQARQAFVFQTPIMLRRTVLANLTYPLQLRRVPRAEAAATAQDWAVRVGLADMVNRSAPFLSGGERQKLSIARALITEPDVLFLDEPTAALDGRATREIEAILQDAATRGTRIIMSTHNLGQARRLANDIVFLQAGQVAEHAEAESFFAGPQHAAAQAYLLGDIVE